MKQSSFALSARTLKAINPKTIYKSIRGWSIKKVLLLACACFLFLSIFGLGSYLLIEDIARRGEIFPGITIEKIDVGGLSREQAQDLVQEKLAIPLTKPLQLYYDETSISIEPQVFDLNVDIEGMVNQAYAAGRKQSLPARMYRRFRNKPLEVNIPLTMKYDEEKLVGALESVAQQIDRSPVDARISISTGSPEILPSSNGHKVLRPETLNNIKDALPTPNRQIPLVVTAVAPDLTEEDIGYIVVLRLSQHSLDLYHQEEFIESYPVAVGSEEYPTPKGKFYISQKKLDPTWIPPKSDWAKDIEPVPPGPDNPLGRYWMGLSAGLVGIHATNSPASIGYSVSHGCVRMHPEDAESLFGMVKVGTPVFILE